MSTEPIKSQQEFLRAAKAALGLYWDELAVEAGIEPRALKNYRMPDASQNHRGMPKLAYRAIEQLLHDVAAERLKAAHAAADYDKWFRTQVQASIDDPRPNISAEDARKQMSSERDELLKRIFPVVIKTPNSTSLVAIDEASEIIKSHRARFATADALIVAMASDTFATRDDADGWLRAKHPLLGDLSPLEAASTPGGARRVAEILTALKWGGAV